MQEKEQESCRHKTTIPGASKDAIPTRHDADWGVIHKDDRGVIHKDDKAFEQLNLLCCDNEADSSYAFCCSRP